MHTKHKGISRNDIMFRLAKISMALLRHGKLKLLLSTTFNLVKSVFVQIKDIYIIQPLGFLTD